MNIKITGSNYAVSNVLHSIEDYLKRNELKYSLICAGGHYSLSKTEILIVISGSPFTIMSYLEYSNVCIEVVEETPGAIFMYMSEKGSTKFTRSCQDIDIDQDFDDFEDEEHYCERMRKIGVMV